MHGQAGWRKLGCQRMHKARIVEQAAAQREVAHLMAAHQPQQGRGENIFQAFLHRGRHQRRRMAFRQPPQPVVEAAFGIETGMDAAIVINIEMGQQRLRQHRFAIGRQRMQGGGVRQAQPSTDSITSRASMAVSSAATGLTPSPWTSPSRPYFNSRTPEAAPSPPASAVKTRPSSQPV